MLKQFKLNILILLKIKISFNEEICVALLIVQKSVNACLHLNVYRPV